MTVMRVGCVRGCEERGGMRGGDDEEGGVVREVGRRGGLDERRG